MNMEIVLATHNKGKINELKKMLDGIVTVKTLDDIGYKDEIIETGNSFLENALIKAKTVSDFSHMITLSDDSGLVVNALNGAPGIYSARYAGNDIENINKVLDNMKGIKNREANFTAVIVLYFPDGTYKSYEGVMKGRITEEPKGDNGFGYDPIMYLDEYGMTSAEIDPNLKNQISHRAIAIKKMINDLKRIKSKNI